MAHLERRRRFRILTGPPPPGGAQTRKGRRTDQALQLVLPRTAVGESRCPFVVPGRRAAAQLKRQVNGTWQLNLATSKSRHSPSADQPASTHQGAHPFQDISERPRLLPAHGRTAGRCLPRRPDRGSCDPISSAGPSSQRSAPEAGASCEKFTYKRTTSGKIQATRHWQTGWRQPASRQG